MSCGACFGAFQAVRAQLAETKMRMRGWVQVQDQAALAATQALLVPQRHLHAGLIGETHGAGMGYVSCGVSWCHGLRRKWLAWLGQAALAASQALLVPQPRLHTVAELGARDVAGSIPAHQPIRPRWQPHRVG